MSTSGKRGLSLFQKIAFSAGECGNSLLNLVFVYWSMYYYAPPADEKNMAPLVPVALAGIAMSVGKVVDAVTDVLVAFWSDRCESRWGRRKPFVAAGAPLLFIVFFFFWIPPSALESTVNLVYLVIMVPLFWTLYTVVRIPYVAMIPEIAETDAERVSLSAWLAVMMIVGSAIGLQGSSWLIGKYSFRVMGAAAGVFCVVCWFISISFVKEKKFVMSDYQKFNMLQALTTSLKNKPFIIFLYTFFSFQLGFNLLTGGMAYIVRVILGLPKESAGIIFLACFASVIVSTPLITFLAKRLGKKKMFSISIFLIGLFLSFTYFLGKVHLPFTTLQQMYVLMILTGFPVAGFFVLPNAMTADIVDYDEKITGLRREAIYYGMSGFAWKLAIAFSATIMGLLFRYFGYSSGHDLGIRLLGPVSSVFIFIALFVFQFYPLEDKPAAKKNS